MYWSNKYICLPSACHLALFVCSSMTYSVKQSMYIIYLLVCVTEIAGCGIDPFKKHAVDGKCCFVFFVHLNTFVLHKKSLYLIIFHWTSKLQHFFHKISCQPITNPFTCVETVKFICHVNPYSPCIFFASSSHITWCCCHPSALCQCLS